MFKDDIIAKFLEIKSKLAKIMLGSKFLSKLYYKFRYPKLQQQIQSEVLQFFENKETEEKIDSLKPFFQKYYSNMIPYDWIKEYSEEAVEVHFDKLKRLSYVYWHGKKMYWKKGVRPLAIQRNINDLLIEQDNRSPHKYILTDTLKGAVIADLGAAEGCFTLDVIEQIEHAYIFECEDNWIEALEATFEPYKDKVTIVKKFIGKDVDENCTTLDEYFRDKRLDYLKADIEGAEVDMLLGGSETMQSKVREVNICLYHTPNDEAKIIELLKQYGYTCQITDGYIFIYNKQIEPRNWFRRGVALGRRR